MCPAVWKAATHPLVRPPEHRWSTSLPPGEGQQARVGLIGEDSPLRGLKQHYTLSTASDESQAALWLMVTEYYNPGHAIPCSTAWLCTGHSARVLCQHPAFCTLPQEVAQYHFDGGEGCPRSQDPWSRCGRGRRIHHCGGDVVDPAASGGGGAADGGGSGKRCAFTDLGATPQSLMCPAPAQGSVPSCLWGIGGSMTGAMAGWVPGSGCRDLAEEVALGVSKGSGTSDFPE